MLVVKPFGTVVICGATSGHTLDFDVRYLWMRQKKIIGSHFANAWECHRANELITAGKVRPVLWRTLGFDQVAEAHQLMYENKHLGKISILVGAESEGLGRQRTARARSGRRWGPEMALGVAQIPWYATLFRGDQFAAAVAEIAPISLRYGALDYIVYRNRDDQYKFMQCATWDSKASGRRTGTGRR